LKALLRQFIGDSSSKFEEQTRTSVDYIDPHRHSGYGGRNTLGVSRRSHWTQLVLARYAVAEPAYQLCVVSLKLCSQIHIFV
jgi:hypothetical protein